MTRRRGLRDRFRYWLAARLFLLAGRVHSSFDVWLDEAPRRDRG